MGIDNAHLAENSDFRAMLSLNNISFEFGSRYLYKDATTYLERKYNKLTE